MGRSIVKRRCALIEAQGDIEEPHAPEPATTGRIHDDRTSYIKIEVDRPRSGRVYRERPQRCVPYPDSRGVNFA